MPAEASNPRMTLVQFHTLRGLIHARSGINIHEGKKFLLEWRLAPRLAQLGIVDYDEYLRRLEAPDAESEFQALCEHITIHETSFFRDAEQFGYLERTLLPELLRRRAASRSVRIWSVACSSGEEPYSLAMLLHQALGNRLADWRVEILGTDLSDRVLARARAGEYAEVAAANVPAALRRRCFARIEGDPGDAAARLRLDPAVAALVRFERHNLVDGEAARRFGAFDVILCENVLIYFDDAMKQHCVEQFESCLATDGWLLVGRSETLHGLRTTLQALPAPQNTVWRRRLAAAA